MKSVNVSEIRKAMLNDVQEAKEMGTSEFRMGN